MRVLLCSPRGNTGGIAQWTSHILDYYQHHVSDLEVKWFYADALSRQIIKTTPILVRIYYGLTHYIPFLKALNRETKLSIYDVVHFVSSAHISLIRDIIALRICKNHKTPTVVHFRFGRIPDLYKKKNWEYRLINYVIKNATKIIVIDLSSYNTLTSRGFKNIFLLPNPLSPRINVIVEKNRGIKRQPRCVLFAGHCVPTKGVFELIEACKQIPNIHLRMIGICDDSMRQKLLENAGQNSDQWLEIMGNQPYEEVIKNMLTCSIFVLPTYTEGFPNVIIESMACACPIITTPVGAIPEMLDIGSSNPSGIVVPVQDPCSLKNAIIQLLSDERLANHLGQLAQKRVNEKYSMEVVWNSLTSIWGKVKNE